MLSCEKLARGIRGRFMEDELNNSDIYMQNSSADLSSPIKRTAFIHIDEYRVSIEKDPNRAKGPIYRSKRPSESSEQGPSLVKTRFSGRK